MIIQPEEPETATHLPLTEEDIATIQGLVWTEVRTEHQMVTFRGTEVAGLTGVPAIPIQIQLIQDRLHPQEDLHRQAIPEAHHHPEVLAHIQEVRRLQGVQEAILVGHHPEALPGLQEAVAAVADVAVADR